MNTADQKSDQEKKTPEQFGPEWEALVKATVCSSKMDESARALFIDQCRRSGMDPLRKEAFCVARHFRTSPRGTPKDLVTWGTRYEFQPAEAGMLSRAERFPDYRGTMASAVYAEDQTILVNAGRGEVEHIFNPAKRAGKLVGAWAKVSREGRLPTVVWLDFDAYKQENDMWAKIPATMIEKCARVAALRKAFPETFGGLYIREEMPAEEFEPHNDTPPAAAEAPAPKPSKSAPAAAVPAAATPSSSPSSTPAPAAEPTVLRFSRWQNVQVQQLSNEDLTEAYSELRASSSRPDYARFKVKAEAHMRLIEVEAKRRSLILPKAPASTSAA